MINNRYILGERLFGGAKSGELFHARDTLAIQNEMRPQVLIHFISSSEMGYSEYRRVSDELKHSQEITSENRSILKVLDAGWTGGKGFFVLESPEAWSVNVLPEISASPTSLHRRADSLVKKLQKQQLVNTGLKPSFFLVASNGELYLLGTALNGFVQNLQADSDLLSGLIVQNQNKTNTGVLKWIGWSLLAFGSASLAGGVYINRELVSAQFPLLFSDEIDSQSADLDDAPIVALPKVKTSQQQPESMITLSDQQVSPVVSAQNLEVAVTTTSEAIVEPTVSTVKNAAGSEQSAEVTTASEVIINTGISEVSTVSNNASAAKILQIEVIPALEPELHQADEAIVPTDIQPAVLSDASVSSEVVDEEESATDLQLAMQAPDSEVATDAMTAAAEPVSQELPGISGSSEMATDVLTVESEHIPQELPDVPSLSEVSAGKSQFDSEVDKPVLQLVQVSRKTIGPEADDAPETEAAVSEAVLASPASVQDDLRPEVSDSAESKPIRAPVSWNGMSEQKVLQRAEKAIQGGRLRSALYYLRALWRKGVKDGELLAMIQKIAVDHQLQARKSLANRDLDDAKVAAKQASRLIREFGLSDLVGMQEQLENELATR